MANSILPALDALNTMVECGWLVKIPHPDGNGALFRAGTPPTAEDFGDFIGMIHTVARCCDNNRLFVERGNTSAEIVYRLC